MRTIHLLIMLVGPSAIAFQCDPQHVATLLQAPEMTLSRIQQTIWHEFQKRHLVYLILKESSGPPWFLRSRSLDSTRENYETYFPTVTLYGKIRVSSIDGATFLDVHAKFYPRPETHLADHYLKTMVSYAMDHRGQMIGTSSGTGHLIQRYAKEYGMHDNVKEVTRSDARKLLAYTIWFTITPEEKAFLARYFFEKQKDVYGYYFQPHLQEVLDTPYYEIRQFGLAMEKALPQFKLSFDYEPEYAGLLIQPKLE